MDVVEVIKELTKHELTAESFEINLDNLPVIFRDPECKAYSNIGAHIANMNGKYVLMVDLNP